MHSRLPYDDFAEVAGSPGKDMDENTALGEKVMIGLGMVRGRLEHFASRCGERYDEKAYGQQKPPWPEVNSPFVERWSNCTLPCSVPHFLCQSIKVRIVIAAAAKRTAPYSAKKQDQETEPLPWSPRHARLGNGEHKIDTRFADTFHAI